MGKIRETTLILGEGPTEFYYFKSLCDVCRGVTIQPDYPKHTCIKDLKTKIEEGIASGYNHIYCVIDMDNKESGPELIQYNKLKEKYSKPISKPRKGINCDVIFFETQRCTELFFLYYYRYTSRSYSTQEALIKDLNKSVKYQKTIDFFMKCKGLHSYFEKNGGSLDNAVKNSMRSMEEMMRSGRTFTYSGIGHLINLLKGNQE